MGGLIITVFTTVIGIYFGGMVGAVVGIIIGLYLASQTYGSTAKTKGYMKQSATKFKNSSDKANFVKNHAKPFKKAGKNFGKGAI